MSRHICGYAVDEHFVFNFADVNIIVCILALILKAVSSNIVVLHVKKQHVYMLGLGIAINKYF